MNKATNRLINTVWCLIFTLDENSKTITIEQHTKDHLPAYRDEKQLPQFCLIEDENRIVRKVGIRNKYKPFDMLTEDKCDAIFEVINPQHVFSYNLITEKKEII